jgi:hypothetical protein
MDIQSFASPISVPHPRQYLAVFARFPYPGRCKTRLIPRLGEEGACLFARAALTDILHLFAKMATHRNILFFTPEVANSDVHRFLDQELLFSSWEIHPQANTSDLGGRLYGGLEHIRDLDCNVASAAPTTTSTVTFIGMDCFDLTGPIIQESMTLVSSSRGKAHMIPACDGGYTLLTIPLDCDSHRIFDQIPWSCSQTACVQRERLEEAGLSCVIGEVLFDVDEPKDLDRLWEARAGKRHLYPRVFEYLDAEMRQV